MAPNIYFVMEPKKNRGPLVKSPSEKEQVFAPVDEKYIAVT